MDNRALEGLEPQKIQEPVVSAAPAPVVPQGLSEAEIADLKHKAEVSSQNFERAKKAELALKEKEAELELLTNQSTQSEFSDEGKALQGEIKSIKESLAKRDLLDTNPILKDKWKEFEEFRADPDNKGMNMKTAAKAFLTESGLLEVRREGLEAKTGGDRIPPKMGMTPEEAENLRTTNWRGYQEALSKGLIPNS